MQFRSFRQRFLMILGGLLFLLMVIGIAAAVFLSSRSQDVRQQAAECIWECNSCGCGCSDYFDNGRQYCREQQAQPAAPPPDATCASGWSCNGNCADQSAVTIFSNTWCSPKERWLWEAAGNTSSCGGNESSLKANGCGGGGGTPVATANTCSSSSPTASACYGQAFGSPCLGGFPGTCQKNGTGASGEAVCGCVASASCQQNGGTCYSGGSCNGLTPPRSPISANSGCATGQVCCGAIDTALQTIQQGTTGSGGATQPLTCASELGQIDNGQSKTGTCGTLDKPGRCGNGQKLIITCTNGTPNSSCSSQGCVAETPTTTQTEDEEEEPASDKDGQTLISQINTQPTTPSCPATNTCSPNACPSGYLEASGYSCNQGTNWKCCKAAPAATTPTQGGTSTTSSCTQAGQICSIGKDIGYCDQSRNCLNKKALAQSCSNNFECQSGICTLPSEAATQKVCRLDGTLVTQTINLGVDEVCTSSLQCETGLVCQFNSAIRQQVCSYPELQSGQVCGSELCRCSINGASVSIPEGRLCSAETAALDVQIIIPGQVCTLLECSCPLGVDTLLSQGQTCRSPVDVAIATAVETAIEPVVEAGVNYQIQIDGEEATAEYIVAVLNNEVNTPIGSLVGSCYGGADSDCLGTAAVQGTAGAAVITTGIYAIPYVPVAFNYVNAAYTTASIKAVTAISTTTVVTANAIANTQPVQTAIRFAQTIGNVAQPALNTNVPGLNTNVSGLFNMGAQLTGGYLRAKAYASSGGILGIGPNISTFTTTLNTTITPPASIFGNPDFTNYESFIRSYSNFTSIINTAGVSVPSIPTPNFAGSAFDAATCTLYGVGGGC